MGRVPESGSGKVPERGEEVDVGGSRRKPLKLNFLYSRVRSVPAPTDPVGRRGDRHFPDGRRESRWSPGSKDPSRLPSCPRLNAPRRRRGSSSAFLRGRSASSFLVHVPHSVDLSRLRRPTPKSEVWTSR